MAGAAYGLVAWGLPFVAHLFALVAEGLETGDWRAGGEALVLLAVLAAQFAVALVLAGRKLRRRLASTFG